MGEIEEEVVVPVVVAMGLSHSFTVENSLELLNPNESSIVIEYSTLLRPTWQP